MRYGDGLVIDAGVLEQARDALAGHDWQRCHGLARAPRYEEPLAEGDRLDLLAEAAWWLGRLDECIDARQSAYRIFDELGDSRRSGQCAVWLYEHHCLRGQPAIGTAWLRRARRVLDGDAGCLAYGALLLREAECDHGAGKPAEATRRAEQARTLARELGSTDLEAEALQTLGRLLIDCGDPASGIAHLDEAMLLAVEGRLGPYSTGKVYCSMISACEELGDLRRAAEWTEATARWSEQHPLAIFPGICRIHRAEVLGWRGALLDAEREATQACAELAGSHIPNAAAAFAEVGDIRRRLGDLAGAESAFARAQELSGTTCVGGALLRLAQGRIDDARRIVTGCLAGQPANRPSRARVLSAAVQVAVAAGDETTARASLQELESLAATYTAPLFQAWTAVARARVQLAAGRTEEAGISLREALGLWQTLDVPYEVATAKTLLGQALQAAGDDEGAQASFAEARTLFAGIGARLQLSQPAESKPPPSGLTEREVEVLSLVAVGLSNKEIALDLHLSPKTVSRHLSNIFAKIGVSSRAAATAFAFQHRLCLEGSVRLSP